MAGQMFFPGENLVTYFGRIALTALGTIILAVGSQRLIPSEGGKPVGLGLGCTIKSIGCFSLGIVGGILVVVALGAALWVFVPFHFERGPLEAGQLLPRAVQFFWSNLGEELVFRGFLLVVLSRLWGLRLAMLAIAILFGLFHLPGLSGIQALKMICTTAACSYLFCSAFIITGTLWTAVALHVAMNVSLHTISGLDGGIAILKPVFRIPYPQQYDPGFWAFIVMPLFISWLLFQIFPKKDMATKQTSG
ncbi:MAG: family intrarane metalloprotease [Verrucomicrobiales bacterium]|nr:family intrarane metalloprotease [Verrucomicrobiales bacterium]